MRDTPLVGVAGAAAIVGDNAGDWIGKTGGQRLAERYGHFVRLDPQVDAQGVHDAVRIAALD